VTNIEERDRRTVIRARWLFGVLVAGEPGIGKSRLAEEVAARAVELNLRGRGRASGCGPGRLAGAAGPTGVSCPELVIAAAVLGADLSLDALAETTGTGVDDVLAALDEAAEAGLVARCERWFNPGGRRGRPRGGGSSRAWWAP
jgi:hypothetical protein